MDYLPGDRCAGTLLGRVWLPGNGQLPGGPSPVLIREDGVFDLSAVAPTVAQIVEKWPLELPDELPKVADLEEIIANTVSARNPAEARFLSPVDLQAVKACGVTFVCSMLERIIEERAGGDHTRADEIRARFAEQFPFDFTTVRPGSEDALALKAALQAEGMWSQYLEVGIGPDAEVFSKAQPLSTVGLGAGVGIHPVSQWNNPEPELVLILRSSGKIVGATLGNDVNLRDIEGRSALLLGKAKDNNASAAIGPWIRLLDETFTLEDMRAEVIQLDIIGSEGFHLSDQSTMSAISRDITDLARQTLNDHHQYPDGVALYTGTLFAPTQDRGEPGKGFTHRRGDIVRIRSPHLGCLENTVDHCNALPPWTFGISELMNNLARRGLLAG